MSQNPLPIDKPSTGGDAFTYTVYLQACHGCGGKGWIENSRGDIKLCPVCRGTGVAPQEPDRPILPPPPSPWPEPIWPPAWPYYWPYTSPPVDWYDNTSKY